MMKQYNHIPIMPSEAIESLNINPTGIYVDCTLGGGSYSALILEQLTTGRLIAIDRDEAAIENAKLRFSGIPEDKLTVVHGNFKDIKDILNSLNIAAIDGAVMDLGVSSPQIDDATRGFSYRFDSHLDMRMDRDQVIDAAQVIATYTMFDLADIFRKYGDEKFAGLFAASIIREREKQPIETTGQLKSLIERVCPRKSPNDKTDCVKRIFQAVRIEVNGEIEAIENVLEQFRDIVSENGRIVAVTFHSIEDRAVKTKFKQFENPCTCPPDFPMCVCGKRSAGRIITKKPLLPSQRETDENYRAHSAKLRIFEMHRQ